MLYHPDINGRAESFPLVCHGEGDEISVPILRSLIRRFCLPHDLL